MSEARAPRILFVSPHLPYPKARVQDDNIDYFYYRNTYGQGLFQLRQMHSWHPLHFLAQNLPVDGVVLENPTWAQLVEEVDRGGYDVVAITFTVIQARKVLEMVTWLADRHPEIEVLLGGYGAAIFDEHFGIEEEIARRVRGICRGEGLTFMRRYLAERWGVAGELPHRQDLVPTRNGMFRSRFSLFEQLAFVSSLGCANGCVFCSTSSAYGRVKVPIAEGAELYRLIREQARRYPKAQLAIVYSENFLEDREKVLEFMRCMEADQELATRPLLLIVFSSARSVARYSVDELVRCGIGTIFIGVESLRPDILRAEGLGKRQADVAEQFARLHAAGISTLGSMIVGWDGHTPENVTADLDAFVALNPTFYQVVPLHPVPGTPLWKRIVQEGRLIPGYRYEDDGTASNNFRYKHFSHEEIERLTLDTYRRLVDEGGPWPFRMFANQWQGQRTLAGGGAALDTRARALRRANRPLLPIALACGALYSGRGFRRRWRAVMGEVWRERPIELLFAALLATVLLPVLALLSLWGRLRFALHPAGDQPATLRRTYLNGSAARPVPR
jgi:radical SAM superfamily enzyme YgiQ (UPF0313 family)